MKVSPSSLKNIGDNPPVESFGTSLEEINLLLQEVCEYISGLRISIFC